MKTYWLLGREPYENSQGRCPFGSILLEELSKVKNNEDVFTAKTPDYRDHSDYSELRSLYSPVSFEDVKRTRSNTATPAGSPARKINNSVQQYSRANNNKLSEEDAGLSVKEYSPVKEKDMLIVRKNVLHKSNDTNKLQYTPFEYGQTSKTCQLL